MIINLKDKQTLEDELEKGNIIDGLKCQVVQDYKLKTVDNSFLWHVFKLKDLPLVLIKKITNNVLTDYFIFCKPEGLNFGTKKDWLNQGCDWLFCAENYSKSIYQNDDEYKILGGPYLCEENYNVVEWMTDVDTLNPYLICIEVDGYIEFYQGCQISEDEVEFL